MTKEDVIRMTREAGGFDTTPEFLARFAAIVEARVAAAEREACAKVCEAKRRLGIDDERAYYGDLMAAAIRARGEKE
jgi:hypothetical protein